MKIKELVNLLSENGRYRIYGYYNKLGVIFKREDGAIFVYGGRDYDCAISTN